MTPAKARDQEPVLLEIQRAGEIRANMKNGVLQHKKPKFKVGDFVRLAKRKSTFAKSFVPGWTDELFKSARCFAYSSRHL